MSLTCAVRSAGSASVAAILPRPEPSAIDGSTARPAPLSWAMAQAAFAAPLLKFGLKPTWTPPPDFDVAENQKGDTSVKIAAFCTAEVTACGCAGEVIQYGIQPETTFLGAGVSACAADGTPTSAAAISMASRAITGRRTTEPLQQRTVQPLCVIDPTTPGTGTDAACRTMVPMRRIPRGRLGAIPRAAALGSAALALGVTLATPAAATVPSAPTDPGIDSLLQHRLANRHVGSDIGLVVIDTATGALVSAHERRPAHAAGVEHEDRHGRRRPGDPRCEHPIPHGRARRIVTDGHRAPGRRGSTPVDRGPAHPRDEGRRRTAAGREGHGARGRRPVRDLASRPRLDDGLPAVRRRAGRTARAARRVLPGPGRTRCVGLRRRACATSG